MERWLKSVQVLESFGNLCNWMEFFFCFSRNIFCRNIGELVNICIRLIH